MVKILTSLKNPCAKGFYLTQKLKPATGIVYLPECSLLFHYESFGTRLFETD